MAHGAMLLWNEIPPAPFSKGGETTAFSYSPFAKLTMSHIFCWTPWG